MHNKAVILQPKLEIGCYMNSLMLSNDAKMNDLQDIVSNIFLDSRKYIENMRRYVIYPVALDYCLYILYMVKENKVIHEYLKSDNNSITRLALGDGLFDVDIFYNLNSSNFLNFCLDFERSLHQYNHSEYVQAYRIILIWLFRYRSEFISPESLTKLVSKLIQFYGVKSIYNPFAGFGSYSRGLDSDVSYYGQEIGVYTYKYARLLLDSANNTNIQIKNEDSYANWNTGAFDAIVSFMPWGTHIDKINKKSISYPEFFLEHASEQAGISIGIYPSSILCSVSASSKELRKKIVDNHLIETIICLPSGLFENTQVASCLIVTNKNVTQSQTIKYIDATDLTFPSNNRRSVDLDVDSIMLLVKGDASSKFVHNIPYQTIYDNDYDLRLYRLLEPEIDVPVGYKVIALSELVTPIRRNRQESEVAPLIQVSNLSKSDGDSILDTTKLIKTEYKSSYYSVNEDVVLVSSIHDLRPTVCINDGRTYYVSNAIWSLKVDSKNITEIYLVSELNKSYVIKQAKLLYSNYLALKDLLRIKILVPEDKSKMDHSVNEETNAQILALRKSLEEDKLAALDTYRKQLRMRKHAISQVLQDIIFGFDNLNYLRCQNGGVLKDDDIISKRYGTNVKDYFEKIGIACERIDCMVLSLTDESEFGESESFVLADFLEDFKKDHIQQSYRLDIIRQKCTTTVAEYDNPENPDESHVVDEYVDYLDKYMVSISKKDLTQVLENILSNADKYAFTENRIDNRVKIEIHKAVIGKVPAVKLLISNNGASLPDGMTSDKVFEWGQSSGRGSGVGGWQVKQIIEHFNGTVRLIDLKKENEINEFTLAYEIVLPIVEEL